MVRCVTLLFIIIVAIAIMGAVPQLQAEPQGSILAIRDSGPGKLTKAGRNPGAYTQRVRSSVQGLESMQYRNFTVLLNALSDGTYEVQASRIVAYGNHRVNSIFSSLYKSSIEFGYKYDPARKRILQYHFLFPPNSLTGWANPGDFSMMEKFDWNELFPSGPCNTDSPVHSLEETGREYLEAACLPDRETALQFAQRFIDYMAGGRGL